jgi:formylglycine-generating enzyme required for sulfatase activity
MAVTDLCPGCFAAPRSRGRCPRCGFDTDAPRPPTALAPGTLLHGQFSVGRVLGRPGGFGITYLAFDLQLETTVAIKEYLPRDLATRATDGATILAQSSEDGELFRYGLAQFLTEARTLAKLDHPNIVRVRHFFEANASAYLVMDYYRGTTLADYLDTLPGGRMGEGKALALMLPVLDGLRAVHAKNFLHRDIKPANIYLAQTDSGGVCPILLDFGAARQAMGERSRSMSVVLTEGYAPFEQYHRKGHQGPWTDVYGAAAVLYRMLTGEVPPEANGRMADDELRPAADFGVSRRVSDVLTRALALKAENRVPTVSDLQALLLPPVTSTRRREPTVARPQARTPAQPKSDSYSAANRTPAPRWPSAGVMLVGVVTVAMLATLVLSLWPQASDQPDRNAIAEAEQARRQAAARLPFEPEMVQIPAGNFLMGCQSGEADCEDNEKLAHRVSVPAFELGKTEVTFDQWDACFADGGCAHKPDDEGWGRSQRPVINVSWDDAQDYVQWLRGKTGKHYRLPSEAEWEYAARAGTTSAFSTGGCINTDQANYDGTWDYNDCGAKTGVHLAKTQPVGSYPGNPWGLHDMQGNTKEWIQDCMNDSYTGAPTDGSAWRRGDCARRGLRGGSWYSGPRILGSAYRFWFDTGIRNYGIGFRVARTLSP